MATVAYDDRSFTIDGRRIWLVSGAVHYFRTPASLWRDRLTKAARGGLNCVETYVAWNVHEPVEGEWDFSGDNDVAEFIQQAGDLGLYVIVRPGPYICAERDFGGLPGWLAAKSGIQVRSPNAIYTHYYDKYLRQLLPRLVDLQVSRGGNIIAIQNENEYFMTALPDRIEYLQFISRLYHRAGFDIPILTCNLLTEPMVPDTVECLNGWGHCIEQVKQLRHMQPDKPLLATEFWTGVPDSWGFDRTVRDPREVARRALELVGCGSQINYYMYHGGTNFGFSAGRGIRGDADFVTTSYDFDAPIAEGGGLTRKYYLLRLVNLMNRHMARVLAAAAPTYAPSALGGPACHCCTGPKGTLVVVSNGGDEEMTQTAVAMPDGRVMDVDLSHLGAVAVMQDAEITERHVLDYSNLAPLGVFAGKGLILHGVAGQAGVVSVNGREMAATVPEGDQIVTLEFGDLKVLVLPSSLAERCWDVDGHIVIGPEFAGETLDELTHRPGAKHYWILNPDGKLTRHKIRAKKAAPAVRPPTLGKWQLLSVCTEPIDPGESMKRLDRVRSIERLGVTSGYIWYRVSVDLRRAAAKSLFLSGCEDRATVFVNGKRVGVWGRGAGAKRTPIRAELRRGANDLTFLTDCLGRFNFGSGLGERKGIWDDVYAAAPVALRAWRIREGTEKDFSRRMAPRRQQHRVDALRGTSPWVCETTFTMSRVTPVHVQFTDLPCTVVLLCNDRLVGFYDGSGGFGDAVCGREIVKGVNRLKLFVWPEITARQLASALRLHRLEDNLTAGRRWRVTSLKIPTEAAQTKRKGLPAWYRARFKRPGRDEPLFVKLAGAAKGQIFLNGRNVGRFWGIGPQQAYYLPECWLEDTNELVIFDEQGKQPTGSKLQFMPLGPFG